MEWVISPALMDGKYDGIRLFIAAVFAFLATIWASRAINAMRRGEIREGNGPAAHFVSRGGQPRRFWMNVIVAWAVVVIEIAVVVMLVFHHWASKAGR